VPAEVGLVKIKLLCVGLVVALLASLGLNAVLYRTGLAWYRDGVEVRLDPTREAQFRRANDDLKAPPAGSVRVVFVGDSRIEQWPTLPEPAGCQSVNRGSGGETTTQVALRLERDVLRLRPEVAVVQAGINDLKAAGVLPVPEEEIVANCERNLAAITSRLREGGVRVVLLTVLPVGSVELARRPVWSDATLAAVNRVNERLRGMSGPGVTVVDCDPAMAVNGRMNRAYARDAFHLTPAGYDALARVVTPALEDALAGADAERGGRADLRTSLIELPGLAAGRRAGAPPDGRGEVGR
jgi:lysophospholipase L1-like esterase